MVPSAKPATDWRKQMLKKLKQKFILITVALLSVVFLAALIGISIFQMQRLTSDSYQLLEEMVGGPDDFHFRPRIDHAPSESRQVMMPTFGVVVNQNGQIISSYLDNVTISDDVLSSAIRYALEAETEKGRIRSLHLLFVKQQWHPDTIRIAFGDYQHTFSSIYTLIQTFLLVGGLVLLAFWRISIFLANMALAPVESAWNKQRQFLADASHELKTPLTVILTNLGILTASPEKTIAEQNRWIENSTTEALRMKELVEQMLFLAKSDTSQLPVVTERIDFSDLVMGSILTMESLAFERNLHFVDEIAPDIRLTGNPAQLKQLLHILLDNACKYSFADNAITVRLWTEKKTVKLSVANYGAVIAESDLPKLFDRFYRADSSRVRETGGYGLGLAIAASIVATHHGQIDATSSSKSGTVFTVSLPAE